jgi:hypothetical protein
MIPDFGGLIWMVAFIAETIIVICGSLLFIFWVMPPISRRFIRMKWSKGSPAFIQHAGRVVLFSSDAELPEGVIHNKSGWYLRSVSPYRGEQETRRGPGRPPKNSEAPNPQTEEVNKALDVALRTPILEGLGRQVFFGSTDTPLLSNLETIGQVSDVKVETSKGTIRHSILSILKEIIPATISRSQLDALGTYEYLRGLKVRGNDIIRLIIVVVAVIGVIGALGLVFWFLTQGTQGGGA